MCLCVLQCCLSAVERRIGERGEERQQGRDQVAVGRLVGGQAGQEELWGELRQRDHPSPRAQWLQHVEHQAEDVEHGDDGQSNLVAPVSFDMSTGSGFLTFWSCSDWWGGAGTSAHPVSTQLACTVVKLQQLIGILKTG